MPPHDPLDNANTDAEARKRGLPPIVAPDSRILILGSLPSDESLRQGRYYANPRNHFWMILAEIYGEPLSQDYEERLEFLETRGLALWDVLKSAQRPGSLDSAIRAATPNDFRRLFSAYPGLRSIGLNGRTASRMFGRYVGPLLATDHMSVETTDLPSSSPIPGRNVLSFEAKVDVWREFLLPRSLRVSW
jgi:TDG/mug DNA glycosylase family protein